MRSCRHLERSNVRVAPLHPNLRGASKRRSRTLIAALIAGIVVGPLSAGTAASATPRVQAPAPSGLGAGGEYHPLAPMRIYDSRPESPVGETNPGPRAATPSQPTFDFSILGEGGVPDRPADVLAVVVNITVVAPNAAGWLNAYGAGAGAGTASIVNFTAGQIVPNLSIVRPGVGGDLTMKLFSANESGNANVVVDVFGWFSTSSNAVNGARLIPVNPGRVLDTRTDAGRTALGPSQSLDLAVRGATLGTGQVIPNNSNIVGVVLNVTGVNTLPSSTSTYLSVVPDPIPTGTRPSTSNLNLVKNQIKPNMVIVPVNADGSVRIYNFAGSTDVVVDVAGYLETGRPVGTREGRVVPLTSPFRVFDTRDSQWGAVALGPGQAEDWSFADFVGSVNIANVAVGNQSAVIGNLTSASLTRQYSTVPVASFLTVYPSDGDRPVASNLNTVDGQSPIPNLAIMKYSNNMTVRVYNLGGYSHYLYDATAVVLSD